MKRTGYNHTVIGRNMAAPVTGTGYNHPVVFSKISIPVTVTGYNNQMICSIVAGRGKNTLMHLSAVICPYQ